MQLIGINNLIILKLFAKLAQFIRINNLLEYSLIRIIRVFHNLSIQGGRFKSGGTSAEGGYFE